MRKIFCEEAGKKDFDKLPLDDVRQMVGWIEPLGKEWQVTMLGKGELFITKSQDAANMMASLEEIKALLLKRKI